MRQGQDLSPIIKDMDDGRDTKLIVFRGIAYTAMPHPQGDEILVGILNTVNGGVMALGVTENLEDALKYIQTLDSDYLIVVAA